MLSDAKAVLPFQTRYYGEFCPKCLRSCVTASSLGHGTASGQHPSSRAHEEKASGPHDSVLPLGAGRCHPELVNRVENLGLDRELQKEESEFVAQWKRI